MHTNEKYRNALHIALQYCKKPFGYLIPEYLSDLVDSIKKKEVSKDLLRFECSEIYAYLASSFMNIDSFDDLSYDYLKFVKNAITFISVIIPLTLPFSPSTLLLLLLLYSLLFLSFPLSLSSLLSIPLLPSLLLFTLNPPSYPPSSLFLCVPSSPSPSSPIFPPLFIFLFNPIPNRYLYRSLFPSSFISLWNG